MLHDFKLSDDGLDKDQRKAEIRRLREKLAAQQQSVMAAKLPVQNSMGRGIVRSSSCMV